MISVAWGGTWFYHKSISVFALPLEGEDKLRSWCQNGKWSRTTTERAKDLTYKSFMYNCNRIDFVNNYRDRVNQWRSCCNLSWTNPSAPLTDQPLRFQSQDHLRLCLGTVWISSKHWIETWLFHWFLQSLCLSLENDVWFLEQHFKLRTDNVMPQPLNTTSSKDVWLPL